MNRLKKKCARNRADEVKTACRFETKRKTNEHWNVENWKSERKTKNANIECNNFFRFDSICVEQDGFFRRRNGNNYAIFNFESHIERDRQTIDTPYGIYTQQCMLLCVVFLSSNSPINETVCVQWIMDCNIIGRAMLMQCRAYVQTNTPITLLVGLRFFLSYSRFVLFFTTNFELFSLSRSHCMSCCFVSLECKTTNTSRIYVCVSNAPCTYQIVNIFLQSKLLSSCDVVARGCYFFHLCFHCLTFFTLSVNKCCVPYPSIEFKQRGSVSDACAAFSFFSIFHLIGWRDSILC